MKVATSALVFALGLFALVAQTLLFRTWLGTFEGTELSIGAFFGSWLLWVALGAWLARVVTRRGGEETLGRDLEEAGLDWPDLDELVLRAAAAKAFVEQRLRPRISVSAEEIEAAYQRLLVEEIAGTGEPLPPLTAVRDHLQRLLVEQKLNDEIERWIEHAGERQEVVRFSR